MVSLRIPTATYRLQFNRHFRFTDAGALVPYLHELGISDIYASPVLEAREKSPHGYDITNPRRLNPELGDENSFFKLSQTLKNHGMGLLLDIVPNHMAASSENPWWQDVLRSGKKSRYAGFFDINWKPVRSGMKNKVLLPVLGRPFAEELENGKLKLNLTPDGLWVSYYHKRFPVSTQTFLRTTAHWFNKMVRTLDKDHPAVNPIKELLRMLNKQNTSLRNRVEESAWYLYSTYPEVRQFIDKELQTLNGIKGNPQSFDSLEKILATQAYRLAYWLAAKEEINYRRFFDVSDLVSIRMEEEEVFNATHSLIFDLVDKEQVTGLRLDHIDGLFDPENYLQRLQKHINDTVNPPGFYVLVEKILAGEEKLPASWPVFGTTGYDFMNMLNGLFIMKEGMSQLENIYSNISKDLADFESVVYTQKKKIMYELFPGEFKSLSRHLSLLAEKNRYGVDITIPELEKGLIEITACLKVYRTYINSFTIANEDRLYIKEAIAEAARRNPGLERTCRFIKRVLLLEFTGNTGAKKKHDWLRLVMRWQQLTGPVMAKGFEDTALYIYSRLISLNEVGGEPQSAGISLEEFHKKNRLRQEYLPHSLNATSTHDTKRSEDVRARINVLSEIPSIWAQQVNNWRRWNRPFKTIINGCPIPEDNTEYFIYQTLIGAWEEDDQDCVKRLQEYMIKAVREAKVRTSWLNPNSSYEKALEKFIFSILDPGPENRFLQDFYNLHKFIAYYGAVNSLAQVLLKITSPGIPDFYQGTEVWNFSLVDPDNRRPVDFETRALYLQSLKSEEARDRAGLIKNLLASWRDGRIKMYLIYKALQLRKEYRTLFANGEYTSLKATGLGKEHACAFLRHLENNWVLVAVPRLAAKLRLSQDINERDTCCTGLEPVFPLGEKTWRHDVLILPEQTPNSWYNVFTGETIRVNESLSSGEKALAVAEVLRSFPAGLFLSKP